MVGILQAIPGTPLYNRIRQEGRLRDVEEGGIRGAYTNKHQTNITPLNMSLKELAEGYGFLVRNLYSYDNFVERLIKAVKLGEKHGVRGRAKISKKGILTLLRLFKYYVLSTDLRRIYMFMRIIAQTLLHNPQHVQTVLMHLAYTNILSCSMNRGPLPIDFASCAQYYISKG